VRVEGKYNFTGTLDKCVGILFHRNCKNVVTLQNRTPLQVFSSSC